MRTNLFSLICVLVLHSTLAARAALLAYEPFTNSPGAAIIGSAGGFGFNGAWQSNNSTGGATNTGYALSYTDIASNTLMTAGGSGLFQGSTSASAAMQPIRLFNSGRGTNGTDGVTTWISFLVAREGPTGTLAGNPYGRGANVPHDIDSGALQKLAIGNSSGATSNTVGLIPTGSGANLKGSTSSFGGVTNFVVVRIDHVGSVANDNAYLFVNPRLDVEPSTNAAGAVSLSGFDFSFDRLRVFAGGQSSATQPYAELVVDEYRLGQTYSDVAPIATNSGPPVVSGGLLITNIGLSSGGVVLSGTGGSNNGNFHLLASATLATSSTNWSAIATNSFDSNGNFILTNPTVPGVDGQFYRVRLAQPPTPLGPTITTQPTNITVSAGQVATFIAAASGSGPLTYQWFFNTSTPLATATNASLTIPSGQVSNAGGYSLRVTNSVGSATSVVATLTVNGPPLITTQPTNRTVLISNNVTLVVAAIGPAPLAYQWYFNTNTPVTGATNSSLTFTNIQTNSAGGYLAVVTNNFGAVTSTVATLTVAPPLAGGAFFVSPSGNDFNLGTEVNPFLTISKGLNTINNNGVLYLRGGDYAQPTKLNLNKIGVSGNAIQVWAYPGEVPVINATGNSSDSISLSGRYYHLKGLTVVNAGHNGINISGHSNTVEFCTVRSNGNTGLHITGGTSGTSFPSYNLILNCDAYLNYDPPIGGNADGFSAKWDLGPGNIFRGCRAWWNSDDGWDLWMGNSSVLIDQCWAFYNGTNYWNDPLFDGNGQGFKLGGNYVGAPHRLIHSVAFRNESNGVDQNNNIAGQTLDNNTSWANKSRNYSMAHGTNTTPHIVRNNLSFAGASNDSFTSGALSTSNSWQAVMSPAANASDVLSVDATVATAPRNPDGSLPYWPFLRPVPAGRLIDKGVNIGEPYTGAAPDLGAFEDGL